MAFINDDVHDQSCSYISTYTENLYLTSAEPSTYAEAQTTYKLATKASPTFTGPANGDTSGRKITCDAISDGAVNTSGTATHWALTDNSASKLLAAGALASSVVLTSGNTFTLTAFDVEFPDPA